MEDEQMDDTRNSIRLVDCIRKLKIQESILDGISDAFMLLNAQTYEILFVNRAFLNLYRRSKNEILGKRCHEITHHLDKPCSLSGHGPCPLEEIVQTGKPFSVQHTHKGREGEKLYFEINAYPVKDFKGEVIQIIHSARDVTIKKKAEHELKEKLLRAEHMAALGQLVAEITHEIKNPLMLIGGFARRLFQPVDEETKINQLTIITEQTARLEKLLKDLREYHLPKAPAHELLDIKELLRKIYSLVKDECIHKNIQINLTMNEGGLVVKWDHDKLEQVFLNVVKNSIEAMENGGTLSIKAASVAEKIEITISDDGCGIPKKHLDKILDCFFTTKSYGTGLGLCISKKYVDEHKGSALTVSSEENRGTTVEISIPVSGEP